MGIVFNVKDHGARGDGQTLDTAAVQRAIDECSRAGGEVIFPAGEFACGTLYLKSHVTLRLTPRARLRASEHIRDIANAYQCRYDHESEKSYCFLFGENLESVRIIGPGTIDGAGRFYWRGERYLESNGRSQPIGLCLKNCRNVVLADLRMEDFGSWATSFQTCSGVACRSVTIFNRFSLNNDGLDFDCCRDVAVHGCIIDSDDDCLCLQNSYDQPCENIMVSDCRLTSRCNPIRIGLLSTADIRNVTVTNCVLRSWFHCSGIAMMNCEGGDMHDMVFSNLVMVDTPRPIWLVNNRIRCGAFAPDPIPPQGRMRDLSFDNIRVTCSAAWERQLQAGVPAGHRTEKTPLALGFSSILLLGSPEQPIENVTVSNLSATYPGMGTKEQAAWREGPDAKELRYPDDPRNLPRPLPSYGLYAASVRGMRLENLVFDCVEEDHRPAIVLKNVRDSQLSGAKLYAAAADAVRVEECTGVDIRNVSQTPTLHDG